MNSHPGSLSARHKWPTCLILRTNPKAALGPVISSAACDGFTTRSKVVINRVFPREKYGAKAKLNSFGFTTAVVIYDTDPTRPVGDWKEAWKKVQQRAEAI